MTRELVPRVIAPDLYVTEPTYSDIAHTFILNTNKAVGAVPDPWVFQIRYKTMVRQLHMSAVY
jgi:hypothetical protein